MNDLSTVSFPLSHFASFSIIIAFAAVVPFLMMRNLSGLSLCCGMLFCSIALMTSVLSEDLKTHSNLAIASLEIDDANLVTGSVGNVSDCAYQPQKDNSPYPPDVDLETSNSIDR